MLRTVSASMDLRLTGPTDMIFLVAATPTGDRFDDSFTVHLEGEPVPVREFPARHGARIHRVAGTAGEMRVEYRARIEGHGAPDEPSELELVEYLRPSRYAEADILGGIARREFGRARGFEALAAVEEWVHGHLSYVYGSTVGTGGAAQVIESGQGVCRDFAHTVAGLLRALDIPARVTAVYAPGLVPPDFHAVTEAWVGGAWHVVDATRLAPRGTMLRISSGRDTADTAFLSNYLSDLHLTAMNVETTADPIEADDHSAPVRLG
ncbi:MULTISPECIES: transglutaminase-like domain-containing protein [unclassified Rathayibacter]|uniref:transglutaminase-like domain-containing protein n=1 Tax=unclassified Rathayibacter TaxID=2609250 RepID=UPI00188C3DC6|nr:MULTISPECIES: transglutaminase family protein [unclassified Rathayibacter]MBF4463502.1 transglutaminase family protein [Rathayibacter sp. VKM Ac-2879]MBF4504776.1 transglutaminase family protein [Rathayibacter sp. VKM Ac-2878]